MQQTCSLWILAMCLVSFNHKFLKVGAEFNELCLAHARILYIQLVRHIYIRTGKITTYFLKKIVETWNRSESLIAFQISWVSKSPCQLFKRVWLPVRINRVCRMSKRRVWSIQASGRRPFRPAGLHYSHTYQDMCTEDFVSLQELCYQERPIKYEIPYIEIVAYERSRRHLFRNKNKQRAYSFLLKETSIFVKVIRELFPRQDRYNYWTGPHLKYFSRPPLINFRMITWASYSMFLLKFTYSKQDSKAFVVLNAECK